MYQPPTNSQWFRCCANFYANSTGLLSKKYPFSTKVCTAPEPLRIGWWLIHQIEALILGYLWAKVGLQRPTGLCSSSTWRRSIFSRFWPLARPCWGRGRISMCHLKALGESFQMIPFGSAWGENWRAESGLFFRCMVSFSLICTSP